MAINLDSVEHVNLVSQLRPKSPRDTARYFALNAICAATRPRRKLKLLRGTPRVQFLLLHHVFADELVAFERLVAFLSQHFSFVSYSDAVRCVQTGNIDKPYLAFSFDDGIHNCLEAARILEQFGTTACFFVCPSIVDEASPRKLARFCRQQLKTRPVRFLASHEIDRLLHRGHEIGAHTVSHIDVANVTHEQASDEIEQSKHLLERQFGTLRHFAWPYGRFANFSAEAAQFTIDVGFESIASGERGCHTTGNTLTEHTAPIPPLPVTREPSRQWRSHHVLPDGPSTLNANTVSRPTCLRRDSVQATWPLAHIAFFLARNARRPVSDQDNWPSSWQLDATPGYRAAA